VFTFEFITPLDINYYFGKGKISSYAQNGVTDAAGNDSSITVGGYSSNPVINTTPPVVRPYINDSLFLNGGITGANTSLFVAITSVTGINVSGDEIGHNLTAVLDGQVEAPYILNNYYQTAPNTYQRGYVTFPLTGLADGPHSMKVTAWDVNNNSGTGEVDFTVVDGQVVDIQDLGNYPNPFSNTTTFVFEHNHPNEALDVQLEIYGVSGALVKSINDNITPTDSRTSQITWDGRDNNGILLPSGVYIYRLNMTTSQGFKSSAYQKLVIVR
jgi:5-hydroxyisourate hydrolase-like protein (transthyretin family)